MAKDTIIKAEDLTKKYGSLAAVSGLDLEIEAGQMFGLLGPNGAGKSTVILMMLGLTEPTGGRITVAGFNSTREPLKVKRLTGYLPERIGFYEDMSAAANLAYTAELNRLPYREIPKKIDEALALVNLSANRDQPVRTFSKGMKQRLGIADVLIKDPKLVIFDEPTEGLDIKVANQILDTLLELNSKRGITFLLSSHQLNLIQKVCSSVGILSHGSLVGFGSIEELGRKLFGGAKFRIEIDLSSPTDSLIARIRSLGSVKSVSAEGTTVRVSCDSDLREDISRAVSREGSFMTRMELKQDALEEIYLRYFKDEEVAS